jgi:phage tail sheath protein FI
MNALDRAEGFDIPYIPPYRDAQVVEPSVLSAAADRCRVNRALLLLDSPRGWSTVDDARDGVEEVRATRGDAAKDAALYFTDLKVHDGNGHTNLATAGGAVAGAISRNDSQRGAWRAPAGIEAVINGPTDTALRLSDKELSSLNAPAVNCLRKLPDGRVVRWGGRTLDGAGPSTPEWKYLPVRRLSHSMEKRMQEGLEWTVFEANDLRLQSQLRASVEAFLLVHFRQGAFRGTAPRDAFFVRCGNDPMSADELRRGLLNLQVGFAALRPAELTIPRLQLRAGT